MKYLLLIVALLVSGPAWAGHKHRGRSAAGPFIVHQVSSMVMHSDASPTWERHITVKNPLNQAIWFWIECESQLTSVAIGQPGRHTSEYVFPGIPPGEGCLIHHWQVQQGTRPPKEWRP